MMSQSVTKPHVILVHGLHMHAWAMQPLAKKLRQQGFETHCFGYYSMWHDLATHSKRLDKWLHQRVDNSMSLYFVGHSLGGLVIRDFLNRYPAWQVERCVTLGTPHNGSLSADRVMKLVPSFVGRSYVQGLDGKVADFPEQTALGSVAGTLSAGLGKLVLPRQSSTEPVDERWQNDGTVFVHETKPIKPHEHICLPASHTGMLLNPLVAEQVSYFLKYGKFQTTLN